MGKSPAPPFLLAPLAGVTDRPFRKICRRYGAAAASTEMVSVKALLSKNPKTTELIKIEPTDGPTGIQLFGADAKVFYEAALLLKEVPYAYIDINMGCPVPKVVKNGGGSALLKNPILAAEIVRAVVKAVAPMPVTVKMRIGFGKENFSYTDFAEYIESAGASAIAVHGRTREAYYSGKADWGAIKKIKDAVNIPIIGNGDVFSGEDGVRMLEETGCDYVMVARGALGNPWIFRDLAAAYKGLAIPKRPSPDEVLSVIKEHFAMEIEEKGERRALLEMRKFAGWYTKGLRGGARARSRINAAESPEELLQAAEDIKKYAYI